MQYFPLFFDLKDKEILIFGGGRHAYEKAVRLLPCSPRLTVIAGHISEELKNLEGVVCLERQFRPEDLDLSPLFAVIAESEETALPIYRICKQRHIPVNTVDLPQYCDFIFPSVLSTGHLSVGISSGGISPTATVVLKEQLQALLPDRIDEILQWMHSMREQLRADFGKAQLKAALRLLFSKALEQGRPLDSAESKDVLSGLFIG